MYHFPPNSAAVPLKMGVDMPNNHPRSSHTKDYFASPALSLSLAGIFRHAAPAASVDEVGMEVEEGEEGSGGGKRDDAVEISSENSGPASRSKSDDDFDVEGDEDEGDGDNRNKKKRKKYHRHTAEQIREMEA